MLKENDPVYAEGSFDPRRDIDEGRRNKVVAIIAAGH